MISAFAAGSHSFRSHSLSEFHDRNKAIAARAVNFFRAFVWTRSERCQRTPDGGSEPHRNTGSGIGERVNDVVSQTLEAIDLAPGCLPTAKVRHQFVGSGSERTQQLLGRCFVTNII